MWLVLLLCYLRVAPFLASPQIPGRLKSSSEPAQAIQASLRTLLARHNWLSDEITPKLIPAKRALLTNTLRHQRQRSSELATEADSVASAASVPAVADDVTAVASRKQPSRFVSDMLGSAAVQLQQDGAAPPRALILTALGAKPCDGSLGNWVNLMSIKNKELYAQLHNHSVQWDVNAYRSGIEGPWNKGNVMKNPPETALEHQGSVVITARHHTVQVAMLLHYAQRSDPARYQWLMWVDYDAMFGDLTTAIPWHRYEGYNMVVWANKDNALDADPLKLNSGVLLLRMGQWTINFLSEMLEYGYSWWEGGPKVKELEDNVHVFDKALYEQNAIAWLLARDDTYRGKVFYESWEYYVFHAQFDHVPFQGDDPAEDKRPLLVVHWSGCQFCTPQWANHAVDKCLHEFVTRWAAVDKQALELLGPAGPATLVDTQIILEAIQNHNSLAKDL